MSSPDLEVLAGALRNLGIPVPGRAMDLLSAYGTLLKKWSRAYNLTAITRDRDIVTKHFLDSILYVLAIRPEARTLLDVGSGAGFPGIPIKIIRPELAVSLMEPAGKKCAFLKHAVHELALSGISLIQARVEEYRARGGDSPERFDVVVTRALFTVQEFLKKTAGLVNDEGVIIMSKGPSLGKELEGLRPEAYSVIAPDLAEYRLERNLLVVRIQRSH